MKKKQTGVWLTPEAYKWLRETAFAKEVSQSSIIEKFIQKEIKKNANK